MKTIILHAFLLLFTIQIQAQEASLMRFPALSPDGKALAFSYQGDIWTVSTDGGIARRLTIHESYESHPRWSPDGKSIAFQGNRFGHNDIFVMAASGSAPKRITYHSTADRMPSWTNDNQLLFETTRNYRQVEWDTEIHTVNANGGTPHRFMDAFGMEPTLSSNGRYMAFIRGACRVTREAYTGPANRNIWIFDTQNNTYQAITEHSSQETAPRWDNNQQLYFLSAASGRYNIHRLSISTNGQKAGKEEALTHFKDEGIRHFDVSANGQYLVLERGDGIYIKNIDTRSKPRRINISVSYDDRFDPITHEKLTSKATEMAVSPNQKHVLIGIRGEIFIRANDKDKKRTVQLTNHPHRDQNADWLNDSTIIFISDRSGNKDLYLLQSSDTAEVNLLRSMKHSTKKILSTDLEEESFILSPNREQMAIIRNRHSLVVVDIDSTGMISNEKTILNGWATPRDLAWSPDGKWLAYSLSDLNFNHEIYIQAADGTGQAVNVSMHPRTDSNPFWSADGSKLGFQSIRNNGDADIWFAWLTEEDWEKSKQEWEEDEDEEQKNENEDGDTVQPITIDLENIHQRLVQVTSFPGDEDDMVMSSDGETFFFTTNNDKGSESSGKVELKSIKWDGTDLKTLSSDMPLRKLSIDEKGKNLYLLNKRGMISKMKVDGGKSESLSFSAKMNIDHYRERQQIIDEVWRSLKHGFYDPKFHGQDWTALREKYEPLALAASTDQDFRDMLNTMLGQLNASHMGVYGSGPEETQKEQTGYLGIEVKPVSSGVQISRIVPHTAADRKASRLEVGEIITTINGKQLGSKTNFYAHLVDTRNERTLLIVRNTAGQEREVIIRPQSSIRNALYEEWVNERKRLTEEYSSGRLGYIHIRGMNWRSFERFERELTASGLGKDGIVIDVRYNGGGWTTDMLMTVLNVRQHAYTVPRGATDDLDKNHQNFKHSYPYGERLPFAALTKPSVALCNQNSYSNAEIFSHAFKQLNHGTLVGMPTFGAVISTGGQRLINGSFVRMPFRGWYVKATGENMELSPAVPDIELENAADSKAKGKDEQLNKAIEVLLEQLKG